MSGKVLKISSNDLYGNVDDREVSVFAVFNHKKYMNKYVIFSFKDEYNNKKLYYGSIHLKKESLVVFSVRQDVVKYIDTFVDSYLEKKIDENEYEIIDISKFKKIELVSYNDKDFDKLNELDKLSIEKKDNKIEDESIGHRKPVFLYIVLIMLILMLGGLTLLYFKPDLFEIEMKMLTCERDGYNEELMLNYTTQREITFDQDDKLRKVSVVDSYVFLDSDEYFEFKDNDKQNEYFSVDGGYKYDDDNLTLKIIYEEKSIIDDYKEMFNYLKKEGYSCIEGTYYE